MAPQVASLAVTLASAPDGATIGLFEAGAGGAAAALAVLDPRDPSPSFDEMAARAGVTPRPSAPGDLLSMEVDLGLYWPAVRPCWQEFRP